jgi:hypothetical protein
VVFAAVAQPRLSSFAPGKDPSACVGCCGGQRLDGERCARGSSGRLRRGVRLWIASKPVVRKHLRLASRWSELQAHWPGANAKDLPRGRAALVRGEDAMVRPAPPARWITPVVTRGRRAGSSANRRSAAVLYARWCTKTARSTVFAGAAGLKLTDRGHRHELAREKAGMTGRSAFSRPSATGATLASECRAAEIGRCGAAPNGAVQDRQCGWSR